MHCLMSICNSVFALLRSRWSATPVPLTKLRTVYCMFLAEMLVSVAYSKPHLYISRQTVTPNQTACDVDDDDVWAEVCLVVVQVTEPTVGEKQCSECGEHKPASHFYKNRTNKDGLFGKCKLCSEGTKKERALTEVTVDSKV